jgi:hypothetical protein
VRKRRRKAGVATGSLNENPRPHCSGSSVDRLSGERTENLSAEHSMRDKAKRNMDIKIRRVRDTMPMVFAVAQE